ncbi:MAG: triose-phosphate isomerase family protein [Acidimicrobiia bacterium]
MKYVLSSWKMYPTVDQAQASFEAIQLGLQERSRSRTAMPRVILCPPFLSLVPFAAHVDRTVLALGAQNCHWEAEGPYTGEVSPRMLRGLVDYVLVGHSERRSAGETDEQVARKVAAVVRHGMTPILLVGEEDPGQDAILASEQQLRQGLSGVDLATRPVLVVYEPTWAIGTEETASPSHVRRSVEHLKGVMAGMGASDPQVLYGGSVNDDNVEELAGLDVLDGVGAGRASLDPAQFLRLVDQVTAAM